MTLPPARYIVLHHDGAWKINLNNTYYGPFATQALAADSAIDTARKAYEAGHPASVLVMKGTDFETLWTSAPE